MPFDSCHQDLGVKMASPMLASTSHCVWDGRPQGAMGTGRAERPGGPRKLQAQALPSDCQGFGGIGFLPPPAALSRFCCFPEGPNYHLFAEPGPWEIGDSSQQGSRGLLSPPPSRTPVRDHLRFGDWFGKNVRTSEQSPRSLWSLGLSKCSQKS